MAEKSRKKCGDDFLGMGQYEDFNRPIYHYCSIEAFMSIIRSRCMHLGDATTMNDYTENRLLGLLFRKIGIKLAERGMSAEDISLINQNFSLNNAIRYIACFSKERDGLFQWVKYGDDGKGVAIGFKFDKAQFSDHLPSCIAGPDLHFSILRCCISEVRQNFHSKKLLNGLRIRLWKSDLQTGLAKGQCL